MQVVAVTIPPTDPSLALKFLRFILMLDTSQGKLLLPWKQSFLYIINMFCLGTVLECICGMPNKLHGVLC